MTTDNLSNDSEVCWGVRGPFNPGLDVAFGPFSHEQLRYQSGRHRGRKVSRHRPGPRQMRSVGLYA